MVSRRAVLAGLAAGPFLPTIHSGRIGAQSAFEKERGVPYGEADGQELLLDVYRPPGRDTPRPAVVLIHGGGWALGAPYDMDWPASELAEEGYVCFSVGYRLLQVNNADHPNRWPAQLDDVQRAVRWIRSKATTYGVDSARIGAYGHSAGGHLAAMLGVRETRDDGDPALAGLSSRVACVVDLAGDHDLAAPYVNLVEGELTVNFLGGPAGDIPDVYRDASPITFVDEGTSPFLLIAGGRDEPRPIEQTWLMAKAVRDAGVEVVCAQIPDADHFDLVSWTFTGPLTLAFLNRHLRPET